MDFESRDLRNALGRFPTGVTVITSGAPGMEYGMTCQSFTSLSLEPPLVLVCVGNETGMRRIVEETGAFTVNVLSAAQEDLSGFFASSKRPAPPHQFDDVAYTPGETGTARIRGATTVFDCRLKELLEGGDHRIVVGEVVAFEETADDPPVLFFGGAYRRLADPADA
ncbi:MAG: 3-hydroxy-9,10-secoandrosta-1,3,5(10)-triene-9,17-dione monooxygenase reductase component [Chloroflexi bacterium]|nr:MAG: 3-hydroxy-9,10-secoandrosta-1,3,5(10)-triene-9,17-dione monooxygenase reductase component [Chloroflexota bacterium]